MKPQLIITALLLVSLTSFAQSSIEIEAKDLPKNNGISPENIFVSGQDILDLGITFDEYEFATEIYFGATDEFFNLSNTNRYLIKYNRVSSQIEFGCLVPSKDKEIFRLNEVIRIEVQKPLDAMSAPITQG